MCIGEKRTLTVPPSYGYGQRAMGPIPAGSTLIFETELMGIDGVEKPAEIKIKDQAAEKVADTVVDTVADKVAEAVGGAAEAVKTMLQDTDDVVQGREEL